MRILISNDDGIQSPGIEALVKALHQEHEVVVAAPADQQSAKSHGITVRSRLYVDEYQPLQKKYGIRALAITGTPADTIKLYLEGIINMNPSLMPDLVISGINDGGNLGTDILYSGTIGAAAEGLVHNINSVAISREYNGEMSFDFVAEKLIEKLPQLFAGKTDPTLMNVNFPKRLREDYQWILCKQGVRDYSNAYSLKHDEEGRSYYVVGGEPIDTGCQPHDDVQIAVEGNIAVTPLHLDRTNYAGLQLGEKI